MRRWVFWQTEVCEDPADRVFVGDEGKETTKPAALAEEDVEVEHAAQKVGPGGALA